LYQQAIGLKEVTHLKEEEEEKRRKVRSETEVKVWEERKRKYV